MWVQVRRRATSVQMTDPVDDRLLVRAAQAGRIRGITLALWAEVKADRRSARTVFGRGLREARALHSAERRLVQDGLYGLVREEEALKALLGTDEPLPLWLGWLVRRGLEPARAEAEHPGAWDTLNARWSTLGDDALIVERLALRHGVPVGAVRRIVAMLGDEAPAFFDASDARAPIEIRTNRRTCTREALADRLRDEGIATVPLDVPDGLQIVGRANVEGSRAFRDGWFEVQDAGSQRLVGLVAPDGPVIDVCAGAGGKALALAALGVPVVALDIRRGALLELERRARRAGVRIETRLVSADRFPDDLPPASRVLVDAPCTGSGVLRRHPDHRWQLGEEDIAAAAALQRRILGDAARLVAPGGRLIYGTCSVLRDEGEDVIAGFLAEHPEFVVHGEPMRTWPQRDDCDGFYAATLSRS